MTIVDRHELTESVEWLENRRAHDCDYCGEPGCKWQNHAEARADVAEWQRHLDHDDLI